MHRIEEEFKPGDFLVQTLIWPRWYLITGLVVVSSSWFPSSSSSFCLRNLAIRARLQLVRNLNSIFTRQTNVDERKNKRDGEGA